MMPRVSTRCFFSPSAFSSQGSFEIFLRLRACLRSGSQKKSTCENKNVERKSEGCALLQIKQARRKNPLEGPVR